MVRNVAPTMLFVELANIKIRMIKSVYLSTPTGKHLQLAFEGLRKNNTTKGNKISMHNDYTLKIPLKD